MLFKAFLDNDIVCYTWFLLIKSKLAKKVKFKTDVRFMEDVLYYVDILNLSKKNILFR